MMEPQSKWWSHKCWTSSSLPHAAPNEASGDLTNAEQPPLSLFLLTVGPPRSPSPSSSSQWHHPSPPLPLPQTEKGCEKKVTARPRVLRNLAVKMNISHFSVGWWVTFKLLGMCIGYSERYFRVVLKICVQFQSLLWLQYELCRQCAKAGPM